MTPKPATRIRDWLTPARWVWGFALASAAVVLVSVAVSSSYVSHTAIEIDEPKRIAACRDHMLARLATAGTPVDLRVLAGVHGLCYAQVDEEDMLVDYGVRRSAYLNQQKQTTILLYMVVVITFSGVVLAGVQLVAGYRLASAGKAAFEMGGSVGLEKDKFSVNSSVTGVLILAISLLFFYVFVNDVYLIKESASHPAVNSIAGTPDLTNGWSNTPTQNPINAAPPIKGTSPLPFVNGGVGPAPHKSEKTKSAPSASSVAHQ
jgi:hypothetical protein